METMDIEVDRKWQARLLAFWMFSCNISSFIPSPCDINYLEIFHLPLAKVEQ